LAFLSRLRHQLRLPGILRHRPRLEDKRWSPMAQLGERKRASDRSNVVPKGRYIANQNNPVEVSVRIRC